MYNFHFQAKEIFLKSILFFFFIKKPSLSVMKRTRKKKSCEICHFSCLKKPWLNWKRGKFWRKIRESSPRGISDRVETRRVKREGKFALDSCGYKPCATAYPATLSTPPIESTVTQPASMPTTEIHSVDAVSRPSACRQRERGIRNSRGKKEEEGRKTNPWDLRGVQTCPRPREIPKLSLRACWLAARFLDQVSRQL